MPLFKKQLTVFYALILLFSTSGYCQIYNTVVEARIHLEKNNEFIIIKGAAFNRSSIDQSLRYVLSVFKTDPESSNKNKNEQSGRFVLAAGTKKLLSTTTINANDESRTIILLLVYNAEDKILGKDRAVLYDDPANKDKDAMVLETVVDRQESPTKDVTSSDVNTDAGDGIVLRGIVVEETKTKPGRDFYSMFYSSYLSNNINSKEIVTIKEIFAMGRNTKIEVKVSDVVVFEFFVRPKLDYLSQMNDFAMRKVYGHLQRQRRDSKIVKRY